MPEPISRNTAVATLLRLGYEILTEEGGLVAFYDRGYPERLLTLDFSQGDIPWDDFREMLEYDHINVATFLVELKSM